MIKSSVFSQANKVRSATNKSVRQVAAKTQFKYVLIFCIILVLPAGILYLNKVIPTHIFWGMQIFALLIGFIHVWQMGKRFDWRNQYSLQNKLILSILIIFFTMVLQSVVVYFCKPAQELFILFPTGILTFLFPLLMFSVYDFSTAIPSEIYKTWKYSLNINMQDMELIDFSNSYIVTFQLRKTPVDFNYAYMKFKAPLDRLPFGDLFALYMNEYSEKHRESPIQYLNSSNQPYDWIFYRKPTRWWNERKLIDPSLTVRENKIKENDIIVSERVEY